MKNMSIFIGGCIIVEIHSPAIIMAILIVHVYHLVIKKDGLAADREMLIMACDVKQCIETKMLLYGKMH